MLGILPHPILASYNPELAEEWSVNRVTAIRIVYTDDVDTILIQRGKDMGDSPDLPSVQNRRQVSSLVYCERVIEEQDLLFLRKGLDKFIEIG